MTWLVKAQLDYETIAGLKIRDSYNWHKKIWDIFPGRVNGHHLPCLFRVIPNDQNCDVWLLCREEPKIPNWIHDDNWKVQPVSKQFPSHKQYRFDLLANPTQRDKNRDSWDGRDPKKRRFTLKTIDEQIAWLIRKAEENGFRFLKAENDVSFSVNPRTDFRFKYKNDGKGIHVGVRYEGILEVTDKEKFLTGFKNGIGSAKAFGFGLLLLVPLQN